MFSRSTTFASPQSVATTNRGCLLDLSLSLSLPLSLSGGQRRLRDARAVFNPFRLAGVAIPCLGIVQIGAHAQFSRARARARGHSFFNIRVARRERGPPPPPPLLSPAFCSGGGMAGLAWLQLPPLPPGSPPHLRDVRTRICSGTVFSRSRSTRCVCCARPARSVVCAYERPFAYTSSLAVYHLDSMKLKFPSERPREVLPARE